MNWLSLVIFAIASLFSSWSGAAPCAPNLPDRLIPIAGEKGTAMWPTETIKAEYHSPGMMAAKGFDHVVAMVNAVTVYPCEGKRPAMIEIQRLEIVRFKKDGGFVAEAAFQSNRQSALQFDGGQWKRHPEWFISGKPPVEKTVTDITRGMMTINLKPVPENIVHLWTHPRTPAKAGERYGILAVLRVTGDARIQLGMDYWKGSDSAYNGWSAGCATSNNCEAWLSQWIGDTRGEFQLVLVPGAMSRP